jgi:hypothetical protein
MELASGLPAALGCPRKNGVKRHSGPLADFASKLAKRSFSDALEKQATSALQSRGGDGFLDDPDQARVTKPSSRARSLR